jgi:DNA invertase Pin-like site-specific DNA recombinase
VKAKRAALYVRVSSGEQNTGAQERALREYVQRRGWKLLQIHRDQGVSEPVRTGLLSTNC